MLRDHAKVVQFISLANEVIGRKKLQKMIFIAKKLNFAFSEKYELHMYGPYSEELTLQVEELCEMGFLLEQYADKKSYIQYSYKVTREGERFLKTVDSANERLHNYVNLIQEKSGRFLELVATLLYFDNLEKSEQIAKVHIVKNKLNFTDDEMDSALAFIEDMQKNFAN